MTRRGRDEVSSVPPQTWRPSSSIGCMRIKHELQFTFRRLSHAGSAFRPRPFQAGPPGLGEDDPVMVIANEMQVGHQTTGASD